jgi:tRNA(Ile2) C34 agmatinyltransferase TiaS
MKKKGDAIWTWCPRCTVRTDHERLELYYRCTACGCLHIGAQVIALPRAGGTSEVIRSQEVYHAW